MFSQNAAFERAIFSRDALFQQAQFAQVQFEPDGGSWFNDARFEGDAVFRDVRFWRHASFANAIFSGRTDFSGGVTFAREADFGSARFCRDVTFEGAKFAGPATFASFDDATFSRRACFVDATFEEITMFNSATFEAYAVFDGASFGDIASFFQAKFGGYTSFASAKFDDANFSAVHADRGFSLAEAAFERAPAFIQAHFEEAPRLDNLKIPELKGIWNPLLRRVRVDADTSARYRALKRLAIQAHDHQLELRYFASELKASRDRGLAFATLAYGLLSNFGRLIFLPLAWWAFALGAFACAYLGIADRADSGCLIGLGEAWRAAFDLSFHKALPFAGVASAEKLDQIYALLLGFIASVAPALRHQKSSHR